MTIFQPSCITIKFNRSFKALDIILGPEMLVICNVNTGETLLLKFIYKLIEI